MGGIILICGLNGAGKSTFGHALAREALLPFVDIEDLYFPDRANGAYYAAPRPKEEVAAALEALTRSKQRFILASVRCDFGPAVQACLERAIYLYAPRDVRMERIRSRSYAAFGERMRPGGDLYEEEERFFAWAAARDEAVMRQWVEALTCPVLRLDGRKPPEENLPLATKFL